MGKQRSLIDNFVKINKNIIDIFSLLNVLGIKCEFAKTDKEGYKGFLSSLQKCDGDIYPEIHVNYELRDDHEKVRFMKYLDTFIY